MSDIEKEKHFPKTSLTLLKAAKASATDAPAAHDEIARRYALPIERFIRAVTGAGDEAEDLSQGFYQDIIVSGGLLENYDNHKGSFRPFLKQSIRNYVKSHYRSSARKGLGREVRPDSSDDGGWETLELQAQDPPDSAFDRAWASELLANALEEVEAICTQRGQTQHFDLFARRYLSANPPSWKELGNKVGLEEKVARSRTDAVAGHFRLVIRRLVAADVQSEAEIDREIASLCARLQEADISENTRVILNRCTSSQLKELLGLAAAPEAASLALRLSERDLSRLITELCVNRRESGAQLEGEALILKLCSRETPIPALRAIKELSKALVAEAETDLHRSAATLLYHAAVAAAQAHHGQNISSLDPSSRVDLYSDLASTLRKSPVSRVFESAIDRIWEESPGDRKS